MYINQLGNIKLSPKQYSNNIYSNSIQENKHANMACNNKLSNPINLNLQPSAINIAFAGYSPERHLKEPIRQLANLIKHEGTKRIAILTHKSPDCDAYGSAIAISNCIKESFGKVADVIVMDPMKPNFKFLDPNNEVKVINEIIKQPKNSKTPIKGSQIRKALGKYDLIITTDTPELSRLDPELKEAFINSHDKKTKIVKIDHHKMGQYDRLENFLFGDINIIDDGKESASQIVMQCMRPLGMPSKKITPQISNAIAAGIISDSANFTLARGNGIFEDAAKLAKKSDLKDIADHVNKLSSEEFKLYRNLLNKVQFSDDGEIAYLIIDERNYDIPVTKAAISATAEISKIDTVKYYFAIMRSASTPDSVYVSLRSKDKPILDIANDFGGGGHLFMGGFTTIIPDSAHLAKEILSKLKDLT